MKDLFLRAVRGERTERPPVWMMRQAGRYLPEYREVRKEYTFREAIETPEVAERVSLQPYERFSPDGVVMYSDILVTLEPLGFDYHIESGVGPVVENHVEAPEDVDRECGDVREQLSFVGELLERLSSRLGDDAVTIGFAGGPFTVASYVFDGDGRDGVRRFRARHPDAFDELLRAFADVTREYLVYQQESGADVLQLFDTWAGVLPPEEYREHVLPLHQEILDAVDVPTILFVRNPNIDLMRESGADVLSLDWTVDMREAREELGDTPVQGNLDPSYLLGSRETVRHETERVIEKAGDSGHVLNLGHGVMRETPVENVAEFFETAKRVER
ncbi:MAG: uroporphyrinogen decarboxylase [Halobacteriales archaeon]|nr:uroporphyrinogen decarboxylase [Halobacteriales archaeon]